MKNFENALKMHEAFWNKECMTYPCVAITAPNANILAEKESAADLNQQWLDVDYRIKSFQEDIGATNWYGAALPILWPNLGPGQVAGLMGSDYLLADSTVWFDRNPMIQDITSLPDLSLKNDCKIAKVTDEYIQKSLKIGKNKFFTAFSDLGGTIDIAAALLGAEELMLNMFDEPEQLKSVIDIIDNNWETSFKKYAQMLLDGQAAYSSWLPIIRKETYYPIQADLSVMLSPDQFEEFVLPSLYRQAEILQGRATYHLDGRGEIKHLDAILSIEGIDTIEWVPDRYDGPYLDSLCDEFYPMLRKIQDSGRRIVLRMVNPKRIHELFENIRPEGVFVSTHVNNASQAEDLLQTLRRK